MSIMNWEPTSTGRVRAVCEYCGRKSKPVEPRSDGQPASGELANGWSVAPYPADYEHLDGSHGAKFTCPSCCLRRDRRQRAGTPPLLSPTPDRAAAIALRRNDAGTSTGRYPRLL